MKVYSLTKIHKTIDEPVKDIRKPSAGQSTLSQTKSYDLDLWKNIEMVGSCYKITVRPLKSAKIKRVNAGQYSAKHFDTYKTLKLYELYGDVVFIIRCNEGYITSKTMQIMCQNRCGQTINYEIESLIINGTRINKIYLSEIFRDGVWNIFEIEAKKQDIVNIELAFKVFYEKFGYGVITKSVSIKYLKDVRFPYFTCDLSIIE